MLRKDSLGFAQGPRRKATRLVRDGLGFTRAIRVDSPTPSLQRVLPTPSETSMMEDALTEYADMLSAIR